MKNVNNEKLLVCAAAGSERLNGGGAIIGMDYL